MGRIRPVTIDLGDGRQSVVAVAGYQENTENCDENGNCSCTEDYYLETVTISCP